MQEAAPSFVRGTVASMCFHFLQTGKCLARIKKMTNEIRFIDVSIPSKRESAWQEFTATNTPDTQPRWKFRFPPNGKVLGKSRLVTQLLAITMSKFRFPPNGKVLGKISVYGVSRTLTSFRFPPTGKVLGKETGNEGEGTSSFVSIPSERESALQDQQGLRQLGCQAISFDSLRPGKCFARRKGCLLLRMVLKFRFPPTGKVLGKRPHFRPRRAVAPETPKPNANCAGLFFPKNLSQKPDKP